MLRISQAAVRCTQVLKLQSRQIEQVNLQCARCMSINTQSWRVGDSRAFHQRLVTPINLNSSLYYQLQIRSLSNKRSFFKDWVENIRQDFTQNKEMKDNLKKFRDEAKDLENSEALQKARQKFDSIGSETSKGSDVLKDKIGDISEKLKDTLSDAEKTELGKKSKQIFSEVGKTVGKTAETIGKSTESIAQSQVFKSVAEGAKAVKSELDSVAHDRVNLYRPPVELRRRKAVEEVDVEAMEENTDATEVVMHKDTKFQQAWSSFKENNQFVHKMFDAKNKYDESDHILARAGRSVTDRVSGVLGGLFAPTELSKVMTEIHKLEPGFEKENFIRKCQREFIPNILEAQAQGNLEILEDWCYTRGFQILADPIKRCREMGCVLEKRIIDVHNVDIIHGAMSDEGPSLVISFETQETWCVRDKKGTLREGDPTKVLRNSNLWVLARDQTELDPEAAWRVMEAHLTQSAEQWI